jgi:hypothetical protein
MPKLIMRNALGRLKNFKLKSYLGVLELQKFRRMLFGEWRSERSEGVKTNAFWGVEE